MAKGNKKETFREMLAALHGQAVPAGKPVEVKPEKKYFLIVCEGRRTEPLYFTHIQKFLPKDLLQTIEVLGQGDNTVNIVRKAIRKRQERTENPLVPNYDEVWAVFDKDDFPTHKYNTAVQMAMEQGIEHGVSNQSFELWYILHFDCWNLRCTARNISHASRITSVLSIRRTTQWSSRPCSQRATSDKRSNGPNDWKRYMPEKHRRSPVRIRGSTFW